MNRETFTAGKLVESRKALGSEWIIKDAQGIETGREPLSAEELARFQAEGLPTPDEKIVADLQGTPALPDVVAALIERFGSET